MTETNIVSISGGKDSAATALLAIEREVPNLQLAFADTGHEHQLTYEYVDYLEEKLGIPIKRVRANFDREIANKRQFVIDNWPANLYDEEVALYQEFIDEGYTSTEESPSCSSVYGLCE